MHMLTRARLLRLGTTVVLGSAVAPAAARAALPVPAPQGDDAGFLQFGVLAERAALAFYRRAQKMPGAWTATERIRGCDSIACVSARPACSAGTC